MRRSLLGLLGVALVVSGCAINFSKRSPWDIQQLAELSDQLERFRTLAQLKEEEANQLRHAKGLLDQGLNSSEATVGYDERGLVTRLVDSVLFDSGKADLHKSAHHVLDKVAKVLNELPGQPVGVEGHTDNAPIKRSGWPDNKALSVARANAVVSYLIQQGVNSTRLMPVGYGEEKPLVSNDSVAGRQKNRRVEIIILPQASGASYGAEAARSNGSSYSK